MKLNIILADNFLMLMPLYGVISRENRSLGFFFYQKMLKHDSTAMGANEKIESLKGSKCWQRTRMTLIMAWSDCTNVQADLPLSFSYNFSK